MHAAPTSQVVGYDREIAVDVGQDRRDAEVSGGMDVAAGD